MTSKSHRSDQVNEGAREAIAGKDSIKIAVIHLVIGFLKIDDCQCTWILLAIINGILDGLILLPIQRPGMKPVWVG